MVILFTAIVSKAKREMKLVSQSQRPVTFKNNLSNSGARFSVEQKVEPPLEEILEVCICLNDAQKEDE